MSHNNERFDDVRFEIGELYSAFKNYGPTSTIWSFLEFFRQFSAKKSKFPLLLDNFAARPQFLNALYKTKIPIAD